MRQVGSESTERKADALADVVWRMLGVQVSIIETYHQ